MDRVSESDRNEAIKAVDAALADGRIVQADRDHRIAQLRDARTPSELQMVTHDLVHRDRTWATYTPPEEAAHTEPPPPSTPQAGPPPSVSYGPPLASSPEVARVFATRRRSGMGCVLIPFVLILLFAGGTIISVLSAIRGSDDPVEFEFGGPSFPGFDDAGPQPPKMHTAAGLRQLRTTLREETGSSQVFRATLYPAYASVEVPAEPTGKRALTFFYDGELGEPSKGTSDLERWDLARIDAQVMIDLVRKAKGLVDDPTTWYVTIRKPGPPFDNGGWLTAHASNEFGESGYLEAALDGTVVNRYVSE